MLKNLLYTRQVIDGPVEDTFRKHVYSLVLLFSPLRACAWSFLAAFLVVTFGAGCASVTQSLTPTEFYERDIGLVVNGVKGTGTLVLPIAASYVIEATVPGKADVWVFSTCHREQRGESLGSRVKWAYTPLSLESRGGCPAQIGSYSKDGRHSWAYIDFATAEATLPAKVQCNGQVYQSPGVTVCQAKTGLTQVIEFPEPVTVHPPVNCPMPPVSGTKLEFPIVHGICVFAFMGQTSGKIHRLTTLGYSKILVRDQ